MKLFMVHVKCNGYNARTGEKHSRTMDMPIRAETPGEAARHPEVDNMLTRLTEGMGRVMIVYRNATPLDVDG